MKDQKSSVDELWQNYVGAEKAADEALGLFLAALPRRVGDQHEQPDIIEYLAPQLHHGGRIYALRVLERWPEVERRRLLPDLVEVASTTVRWLQFVRAAIASLDRTWLEANIEAYVWQQLGPQATDEQYRRLAELLHGLGLRELLQKLVVRAAANTDEDVREVAEDFGS